MAPQPGERRAAREAAGNRPLPSFGGEVDYLVRAVRTFHAEGPRWGDIGVLYRNRFMGEKLAERCGGWLDGGSEIRGDRPQFAGGKTGKDPSPSLAPTCMPELGIVVPNMGTKSKAARRKRRERRPAGLADALFTRTQQRVLGLLFGQPGRSFYATELIGLTGAGSGAVQRELARLAGSGLLTVRAVGNQKHYQANAQSPLFEELRGIALKTVGLAEPLREALGPLAGHIDAAFIYGSVAKAQDTAASDIDLMVLSDKLTYGELFAALEAVSTRLGRRVNPSVLSRSDLAKRLKRDSAFVTRVLSQPKIWVVGGESDLAV